MVQIHWEMSSLRYRCNLPVLVGGRIGQSYSKSLFTDNLAYVTRNMITGMGLDSTVKISGKGSFGVDEYEEQTGNPGKRDLICMMNDLLRKTIPHFFHVLHDNQALT